VWLHSRQRSSRLKIGTFKSASRKVPYTENLYRRTFDDEDHTMGRVGANAKVKLTNINAEFYRFGWLWSSGGWRAKPQHRLEDLTIPSIGLLNRAMFPPPFVRLVDIDLGDRRD